MTWKSTLKTGMAIARRMERAQNRRAKEVAKQYKQLQKQEMIKNAGVAVKEYDDYITLITSIHSDASEVFDWNEVLGEPKPPEPKLKNTHQNAAEHNLRNYKPSFFDSLFGKQKTKIFNLEYAVMTGKNKDISDFEEAKKQHAKDLEEWERLQRFVKGISYKDTEVYKAILEYFNPFSGIKDIGSGLKATIHGNYIQIELMVNGNHVIPDFVLTQTSTGKLSNKKITISKFNELYQDYICGCVLRIARELFALLPIEYTFVTAMADVLNTSTGNMEQQPILSVAMPRQTIDGLNFSRIDASDSMRNFVHNMKFSKTAGFNSVEKILPSDIKM